MSAARVLLTGLGGPAGRSLARQLLDRGYQVVGVDMAPTEIPGVNSYLVPAAADPRFGSFLGRIAALEQVDLVIPTVTEELMVLATTPAAQFIPPGVPMVVAPEAAVAIANDKFLTCRRLSEVGLGVPRYVTPDSMPSSSATQLLGAPYLSKPRISRGGRGVLVHDSPITHPQGEMVILQEFISGKEYAPNVYVAADPADDVVVVLEKTALAHGIVGNATAVQRSPEGADEDVARLALAAARAVGLTGPVDVDIRRRADGTPVVLEINARFGANSAHAPEVLDALLRAYLPVAVPVG